MKRAGRQSGARCAAKVGGGTDTSFSLPYSYFRHSEDDVEIDPESQSISSFKCGMLALTFLVHARAQPSPSVSYSFGVRLFFLLTLLNLGKFAYIGP
jgi:hypothetical protein